MECIEAKPFKLLPCGPDVCQECATDHTPEQPHNQQSLYYQYKFYFAEGRWPTWTDAMNHCSPQIKSFWMQELEKLKPGLFQSQVHRNHGNPEMFLP